MVALKTTIKALCLAATLLPWLTFAANSDEYKVSEKLQNGDYVINGMTWRPAKGCPHINKGDYVVFSQGNRNGNCVSATIVKGKEQEPCKLWCDI